jgi:hypothetical protein
MPVLGRWSLGGLQLEDSRKNLTRPYLNKPGVVAHACDLSYLGGAGRKLVFFLITVLYLF